MKTTLIAAALAALVLGAPPALSAPCDEILKRGKDLFGIVGMESELDLKELAAEKPKTNAAKRSQERRYCAASSEMLGTMDGLKLIFTQCATGDEQRRLLTAMDEGIKKIEVAVGNICAPPKTPAKKK